MPSMISRREALAVLGGSLVALSASPVKAATEKLRVGKAVIEVFGYIPLDVGIKYGFFEKQGLEIEEINFAGGPKLAQRAQFTHGENGISHRVMTDFVRGIRLPPVRLGIELPATGWPASCAAPSPTRSSHS
jgi:hypothetical protein